MFKPVYVFSSILIYYSVFLAIGVFFEFFYPQKKFKNIWKPLYSLSLLLYLMPWTFYGATGVASDNGMIALSLYVGMGLSIFLWPILLKKIIYVKEEYKITSIPDFVSVRYGKSQGLATLLTIFTLIVVLPCCASQLRAINNTIFLCLDSLNLSYGEKFIFNYIDLFILFALLSFTILVGARKLDPTERHPGIIATVAIDVIVKMVVIIIAGFFIVNYTGGGIGQIFASLNESYFNDILCINSSRLFSYVSRVFLSMAAALFLPIQFHLAVVENSDKKDIYTALKILPISLILISFFIVPIAIIGLKSGYLPKYADYFMLKITYDNGAGFIAMLIFISAFSAASFVIVISSIVISIMATNHIILPLLDIFPRFSFLKKYILYIRRVVILAFMLAVYLFERKLNLAFSLAEIEIISFTAVIQFLPVIIGGLYWKKGNKTGAYLGLLSGFFIWGYTLFFPLLVRSFGIDTGIINNGLFGIAALKPESLFNISFPDNISHALFWSLFFNIIFYIMGSLMSKRAGDELQMAHYIVSGSDNVRRYIDVKYSKKINLAGKITIIRDILNEYLSKENVELLLNRVLKSEKLEGIDDKGIMKFTYLIDEIEKQLSGFIGVAAAHNVMKDSKLYTKDELATLSVIYTEKLNNLNLTSAENKVNYYQEREHFFMNQAAMLEELVKKRTEELKKAYEKLLERERLAALGKLTSTVSQELRNPLGTIKASLYAIKHRLDLDADEKLKTVIRRTERNVDRCDFVIEELLEYSKIRELNKQKTNLDQWLFRIINNFDFGYGIEIKLDLNSGVEIEIDRLKLKRCIVNVLKNAKFSIDLKKKEKKYGNPLFCICVETLKHSSIVEIRIRDTGVGISEDKLKRVFEPLFSFRNFGIGLGLPIVKQIVSLHDGGIHMDSIENEYTSVVIWLPLDLQS